eukprot:TRINITY_DN7119_c0_g1_i1.p1 TRINITY_DN7119_c0_g1~~TRINITY_DN7119_c0_g1_i1.p1  ORF type:complete len:98 (+),score=29.00 TRINITY_DN7119_c0_g1_i1:29-295(+)
MSVEEIITFELASHILDRIYLSLSTTDQRIVQKLGKTFLIVPNTAENQQLIQALKNSIENVIEELNSLGMVDGEMVVQNSLMEDHTLL